MTTNNVQNEKESCDQILKSSVLIGASSAINIGLGIIRTKIIAMLLGPAGFGLAGLYSSLIDVVYSIIGVGVSSSGVRQIAEASASNNQDAIARTIFIVRRTSVCLGLFGAVLLFCYSEHVSMLTFGNSRHGYAVRLLSLAVFFRLVASGQTALIQGLRRISDLAKVNTYGALGGLLVTVPIITFYREQGVVPSLVAGAIASVLASWWHSRRIRVPPFSATSIEMREATLDLLRLGFVLMASGMMVVGSSYVVRVILLQKLGMEATGLYQSAWTLGGLYVGFVLQAMAADFYPRLTASAHDDAVCNRLVNEQTRIGVLLGGPGAIATLTFAPTVMLIFYTAKFEGAVEVMRWVCLGVALRVITWPLGFIVLAKGRQALFFWSDFAWTVVNLALTWLAVSYFGLKGAGIALLGSYVFQACLVHTIARSVSGFRWAANSKQTVLLFLFLIAIVFISSTILPFIVSVTVGLLAVVLSGIYSLKTLLTIVSIDRIPNPVRQLLIGVGLIRLEVRPI